MKTGHEVKKKPRKKADPGQRTASRIRIEVNVAHDGDPDVLAHHLAIELEAMIDRAPGIDVVDWTDVRAKVVHPGDEFSAALPAWFTPR